MTSGDPWQVGTALNRLRRAAELIARGGALHEIVAVMSDAGAVLRELPGDPQQVEEHAAAMRAMAAELEAGSGEAGRVADRMGVTAYRGGVVGGPGLLGVTAYRGGSVVGGSGPLGMTSHPGGGVVGGMGVAERLRGGLAEASVGAVWEGGAADASVAALNATRDLMEQGAVAMRAAGDLLEDYADTLRRLRKELAVHRDDLLEARRELDSLLDFARTLFAGDLVRQVGRALRAIRGGAGVYEQLRDAADRVRRGLRDVEGRARAGALGAGRLSAGEVVRLAGVGAGGGPAREESAILSSAQLRNAAGRIGALSTEDGARFRALLVSVGSDAERAYLLKALAAGHPMEAVERFAAAVHGRDERWLRRQLCLVNAAQRGSVSYDGRAIAQYDGTTCGSTSIMVARAMNDPLYALSLTTDAEGDPLPGGGFYDRLRAEEQRIHDATNKVWPQALGTTPWGVVGELNRHGAHYDWRVVDDTDRRSVGTALAAAVGAVDAGHPVPVLIGDGYPRHYVLLIGHEGENLVFYNPSGHVVQVSEADFRTGNMSALGYRHVQGVVTPA